MPVWPARQTMKTTLPYGVGTLPPLTQPGQQASMFAGAAWTGSSLAAARPGGYRDGAEDARTVPSAATATTAVSAWWLWTGPVIAGTTSVLPSVVGAWPGRADWPGSPSTVPAGTPPG